MVRCPVCTKIQVVYVEGPTRTSCHYCGGRWMQSGDEQNGVVGHASPGPAVQLQQTTKDTS